MRFLIIPLVVVCCAMIFFTGCSTPVNVRGDQPPAISEIKIKKAAHGKRAAITIESLLTTPIGRQAETLLLQTLIQNLRKEAPQVILLTPDEPQFPSFMQGADPFSDGDKIFSATDQARMAGFNFLMQTSIVNIRPHKERTGLWWFRKERNFLTMVAAIDVYDTFTASKLYSNVVEKEVKLEQGEYEAYVSAYQTGILPVDAGIVDMAEELADGAAKAMTEAPWMAAVKEVNGSQVTLASGRSAGLANGEVLTLFDFSRTIEGVQGLRYRVPGYKIADIRLEDVGEYSATATLSAPAEVHVGDIVVQVK